MLKQDSAPCYYLYRLIMGERQQTGLVAAASVADYDTNRIRKHEFTRPTRRTTACARWTRSTPRPGPVFLTYKHNAAIDELVASATAAAAEIDASPTPACATPFGWSGIRRTSISSPAPSTPWIASTSQTATTARPPPPAWPRRAGPPTPTTRETRPTILFLSVIFPDNQMQMPRLQPRAQGSEWQQP